MGLLSSLKNFFGFGKPSFQPVIFATERHGAFRTIAFVVFFLAILTIPAFVYLANNKVDFKSHASGTLVGNFFCGGKKLCSDGKCEGESWADCTNCPTGRARMITETSCEVFEQTECVFVENCSAAPD